MYNLFLELSLLNRKILILIFIKMRLKYYIDFSYTSKSRIILKSFRIILNIKLSLNNKP